MRALRFHAARDLRIEEVAGAVRRRAPGEVVVRVATCGICGTDLHEYIAGPIVTPVEPHPLTGAQNPQILGHEFAGDVVAVGPGVTRVAEGDRVAIMPLAYCGHCALLPARAASTCARRWAASGSRTPGAGWPSSRPSPSTRSSGCPRRRRTEQGALIEPTAVAAYGVERAGVGPGDRVLVTGAGPIGALAALCARAAGASDGLRLGAEPGAARAGRGARRRDGARPDVASTCPAFLREQTRRARRRRGDRVLRAPERLRRRPSARCAGAARSRRPGCSSARRRSSRCSGRSTT